jgi:predicted dehydrogenase/threonine dehydrogenase-like Zn-dependent dehydrogenase
VKQVLIRGGRPVVEDVPAPQVEPGTVVVRVAFSCVSPGTELAGMRAAAQPLWKRALAEPAKVGRVLGIVREQGVAAAVEAVRSRVDRALAVGYSAAGTVAAVGPGVSGLAPGDRVACAGAGYANHAEVIRVPHNLVVPVPQGVALEAAATVTLGAIALQGVRRLAPTLGETFVVMGLGALGQLAVQIVRSAGCRAVGLDPDTDRVALARELGADPAFPPDAGLEVERVLRLTGGHGADGVVVTAAAESDELISTAFRMCRKKGRVVLVGDVGLDLKRADLYEKELDFLVSTSYGPGRYDPAYEEGGLDYPIGYVRWTENRNMAAYLEQIAAGRVRVEPLVRERFDVADATAAYEAIERRRALSALIAYPAAPAPEPTRVPNPAARAAPGGAVRLALVGAGAFAKGVHLPLLRELGDLYAIRVVASRTGHNAQETARQIGAAYATTDFGQILADGEIDAVLIATRHHLHAPMALAALAAGKHVLLEKPLALTRAELDKIRNFFADARSAPVLLTGYNRRFSPAAAAIRAAIGGRSNPMLLDYRMNAGRMPPDHWTLGPEGGGRNLGEACHIYDLFTFLIGARVASVAVSALAPATDYYRRDDNFVASLRFADGSVASLAYTALGSAAYPKERLELFAEGTVVTLDDYREVRVFGRSAPEYRSRTQEKGLREELAAFHRAVKGETDWPIPLWEQLQSAEIAFDVQAQLEPSGDGGRAS